MCCAGLPPWSWPGGLPTSEMSVTGKFVLHDLEFLFFVVRVRGKGCTNEKKDRKSKKEKTNTKNSKQLKREQQQSESKADKAAVTSKAEIKYRKPVDINKGKIKLKAKLLEINKRIARVHVKLFNNDHLICSEAWFDYFIVADGRSENGMIFPGKAAFYK